MRAALLFLLGSVVLASDLDLYLAAVNAASASLRLNETGPAKRWLAAAPAAYRNWEWHYLNGLGEQSLRVATGHDGPVNSVRFSRDGSLLASTSVDKSIRFWVPLRGWTEEF